MKIDGGRIFALLLVGALVGCGIWFANNSEWVNEEVQTPPRGEAKADDHYAIKQVIRRLGGKVVTARSLQPLPPLDATLVLRSREWDVAPGSVEALQHWVEAGGRLVIPTEIATRAGGSSEWIPIERVDVDRDEGSDEQTELNSEEDGDGDSDADGPGTAAGPAGTADTAEAPQGATQDEGTPKPGEDERGLPAGPRKPDPWAECPVLQEAADLPAAFGAPRGYRVCAADPSERLKGHSRTLWALDNAQGHQWLRVAVGKGSVTATGDRDVFDNTDVLHIDHALAFVAAAGVEPGRTLWFVAEESPAGLLDLIWQHGQPAVLLGGLLLLAVLWRGAPRFGPPLPRSSGGRRSMAEQVRGTAAFLLARGPTALLHAQCRALEETARGQLPDFEGADLAGRAEAIAKATGHDAAALARAMAPASRPERAQLAAAIALLESARRRLAPPRPPR